MVSSSVVCWYCLLHHVGRRLRKVHHMWWKRRNHIQSGLKLRRWYSWLAHQWRRPAVSNCGTSKAIAVANRYRLTTKLAWILQRLLRSRVGGGIPVACQRQQSSYFELA
jgi:hypothetical protein